ncbi:MAG TPA: hypothetical protein VIT89_04825 [Solirubrobacterales bacterium]
MIAALFGGCGEGSEASSSLTKAEFVKQADAVCAKRKTEWQDAVVSYEKEVRAKGAQEEPAVQREIADELMRDSMLPALKGQLEQLEKLEAPEGSETQVKKMLQALSGAIRKVEDEGAKALSEATFATFEEQADTLGVTCPL